VILSAIIWRKKETGQKWAKKYTVRGPPKGAKKALCSSGIKGKPDDFFSIPVIPIKIENHEDSV
jgi:hypothetical protein